MSVSRFDKFLIALAVILWAAIIFKPTIAQFSGSLWFPDNNNDLTPVDDSFGVRVPSLTDCDTIDTDSTGVFECGTDTGGSGGGGDSFWATTTANSFIHNTPTGYTVVIGDNATSTNEAVDLEVDGFSILPNSRIAVLNSTSTLADTLRVGTSLVIDSQTFDSLTDDATLDNNSGDLRVVDVNCTDCLNATEIEDIYLLNSGDTGTGLFTFNDLRPSMLNASTTNVGTLTVFNQASFAGSLTNTYGLTVATSTIITGNTIDFQNGTDSITGWQISDADGGTSIVNVDTQNERVGIGTDAPAAKLQVTATLGTQPSNNAGTVATFVRNQSSGQTAEIAVIAATDGTSSYTFGDQSDIDVGKISYVHGTGSEYMEFFTNAGSRGKWDANGLLLGTSGRAGASLHVKGTYTPLFASATSGKVAIFQDSFQDTYGLTIATSTYISNNLTVVGAATTTNLGVTGLNASNCDVKATTDGSLFCGTDANSGGAGASNWHTLFTNALTPTNTSAGIFVNASSTFNSELMVNGTTTISDDLQVYKPGTVGVVQVFDADASDYVLIYNTGTFGQLESSNSFVLSAPEGVVAVGTNNPQFTVQYGDGSFRSGNFYHDDTDFYINQNGTGDIKFLDTIAVTGQMSSTATTTLASGDGNVKTGRLLQVGNVAENHYVPSGGDNSAFIVIDKPNSSSDASLLLGSQGDLKWEIGAAGGDDLFWKTITGTEATGYTFTNVFFMDYETANVGIGTEAPSSKFEIASSSPAARVDLRVTNKATSGTDGSSIQLVAENDADVFYIGTDAGLNGSQNAFLNWGSFGTGIFIDASGNVGINDTSLSNSFEVTGNSLFTGNISVTGVATSTNHAIVTSFKAPYAAAPTVDDNGELAIDSTSNQFKFQSGGSTRVLVADRDRAFTLASSTLNYIGSATSTVPLNYDYRARTINKHYCRTDAGTVTIRIGDGTNYGAYITINSSGVDTTSPSNNSFTANEKMEIQVGNRSGFNFLTCSLNESITAD